MEILREICRETKTLLLDAAKKQEEQVINYDLTLLPKTVTILDMAFDNCNSFELNVDVGHKWSNVERSLGHNDDDNSYFNVVEKSGITHSAEAPYRFNVKLHLRDEVHVTMDFSGTISTVNDLLKIMKPVLNKYIDFETKETVWATINKNDVFPLSHIFIMEHVVHFGDESDPCTIDLYETNYHTLDDN